MSLTILSRGRLTDKTEHKCDNHDIHMYECMTYFITCSISILSMHDLDCEVRVRIFREKSHLLKLRLGSLLPDFYLHSIQCLLFVQIKLRSPQVVLISQGLQNRIQHLLLEATKFFFSCETNS